MRTSQVPSVPSNSLRMAASQTICGGCFSPIWARPCRRFFIAPETPDDHNPAPDAPKLYPWSDEYALTACETLDLICQAADLLGRLVEVGCG